MKTSTSVRVTATVVLAILAAFAVLASLAADDAEARKKRSVTKTFSNQAAIAIPHLGLATPYPSTIAVGASGKVLDVNVTLNDFTHTYPGDVDVALAGPQGQCAIAQSDAGSGLDVTDIDLTLDDEASSPLPPFGQITSGTFKPTDYDGSEFAGDTFPAPAPFACSSAPSALSVFDGTNPNGTWSLYVVDNVSGEMGQYLGGWSLTIKVSRR